jgi:hypothetical protein
MSSHSSHASPASVRRDVNAHIYDLAGRWHAEREQFSFLCECGDDRCSDTIQLAATAYAAAAVSGSVVSRRHRV